MTFKDYIFILKLKGIPTEAVKNCESFVMAKMRYNGGKGFIHKEMGFAELRDITGKEQSIKEIVTAIYMACADYDDLGRDVSKRAYKRYCSEFQKHLARKVLKSFYLHYHNISEEPEFDPDNINHRLKWDRTESLYRLNAFKEYA